MFSQAEENYLKTIFSLEYDFNRSISTNCIAEKLATKASSVTDMIKRLSLKELVNYKKYKGVSLSIKGKKAATEIIRKHRLWETFLVEKLDFKWDEVHEIAEQLEHVKSDKLIAKLDSYLDFPKNDPHGDPIPDEHGIMRQEYAVLLSDAKVGKTYKISTIKDSSNSFLQYLDSLKININTVIKVIQKMEYDNSILLEVNETTITLSQKACDNLLIKN